MILRDHNLIFCILCLRKHNALYCSTNNNKTTNIVLSSVERWPCILNSRETAGGRGGGTRGLLVFLCPAACCCCRQWEMLWHESDEVCFAMVTDRLVNKSVQPRETTAEPPPLAEEKGLFLSGILPSGKNIRWNCVFFPQKHIGQQSVVTIQTLQTSC